MQFVRVTIPGPLWRCSGRAVATSQLRGARAHALLAMGRGREGGRAIQGGGGREGWCALRTRGEVNSSLHLELEQDFGGAKADRTRTSLKGWRGESEVWETEATIDLALRHSVPRTLPPKSSLSDFDYWGRDGSAVRLYASHQGQPGSIPGRFAPGFRKWESCPAMPLVDGFSPGSPVSPLPLHSGPDPHSPQFTVFGSQVLDSSSSSIDVDSWSSVGRLRWGGVFPGETGEFTANSSRARHQDGVASQLHFRTPFADQRDASPHQEAAQPIGNLSLHAVVNQKQGPFPEHYTQSIREWIRAHQRNRYTISSLCAHLFCAKLQQQMPENWRHLPASTLANRVSFAPRCSQSDTKPVPRAPHSQSENGYEHRKERPGHLTFVYLTKLCPQANGYGVRTTWFKGTTQLLASCQSESGSIPCLVTPGFSQVIIVPDYAAGQRVFSGISRFPALELRRRSMLISLHPHWLSRPRLLVKKPSRNTEIVYGWKEHLKSNPVMPIKLHMIKGKRCRERKINIKASERVNYARIRVRKYIPGFGHDLGYWFLPRAPSVYSTKRAPTYLATLHRTSLLLEYVARAGGSESVDTRRSNVRSGGGGQLDMSHARLGQVLPALDDIGDKEVSALMCLVVYSTVRACVHSSRQTSSHFTRTLQRHRGTGQEWANHPRGEGVSGDRKEPSRVLVKCCLNSVDENKRGTRARPEWSRMARASCSVTRAAPNTWVNVDTAQTRYIDRCETAGGGPPVSDWPRESLETNLVSFLMNFFFINARNTKHETTRGRGDVVVRLLASHLGEPVRFLAESLTDFRTWGSCRTMPLVGGFSRGSQVSPILSFRRCSILTSLHPHRL
ncbi:hypothetical protein PR048_023322 [Dryococelus australis]|uniref:Uncharacterized protein n=1 Tax=Dryococelus australis TaxID=614101 RepID=A0ABQ9GTS9_9NEOP|nr:hypothetical protein PR048_023322 [Dryococelus australis]